MQIQTVFKVGNSTVVAIPKALSRELNIQIGQKVLVDKTSGSEAITIKKLEKAPP